MFNYNKKTLYICIVLIALMIFISIEMVSMAVNNSIQTSEDNTLYKIELKSVNNTKEETEVKTEIDKSIWELEIPNHQMKGVIKEGTGADVLENYIGHFEDTPKETGNVCLASHNRGSVTGDYFKCLEDVEIGETIIYRVNGEEKTYKVILSVIINEIDFSYIKNTNDDRLTLITCIKNRPNVRRCVQAIKI